MASGEVVASRTGGTGSAPTRSPARPSTLPHGSPTWPSLGRHSPRKPCIARSRIGSTPCRWARCAVEGLDGRCGCGASTPAPAPARVPRPFVGRRAELGSSGHARRLPRGRHRACRPRARRGRHRQVAARRGVPAARGGAGLRLPRGLRARLRRRQGTGPDPRDRARPARRAHGSGEEQRRAARSGRVAEGWSGRTGGSSSTTCSTCRSRLELRAIYDAMDNAVRNRSKRETVAALVRAASAKRHAVLVVEDVHWADAADPGCNWRRRRDRGRMPGGAGRDLPPRRRSAGRGLARPHRGAPLVTVDLGPLRPAEALELAGTFLAATDAASAGLRRARARQSAVPRAAPAARRGGSAGEGVPDTIRSLVLARTDRLEPVDRRALQAASVLGQRVPPDALRHAARGPGLRRRDVWSATTCSARARTTSCSTTR